MRRDLGLFSYGAVVESFINHYCVFLDRCRSDQVCCGLNPRTLLDENASEYPITALQTLLCQTAYDFITLHWLIDTQ